MANTSLITQKVMKIVENDLSYNESSFFFHTLTDGFYFHFYLFYFLCFRKLIIFIKLFLLNISFLYLFLNQGYICFFDSLPELIICFNWFWRSHWILCDLLMVKLVLQVLHIWNCPKLIAIFNMFLLDSKKIPNASSNDLDAASY